MSHTLRCGPDTILDILGKKPYEIIHKSLGKDNIYDIYLCGDIEPCGEYIEVFSLLEKAEAGDCIRIILNTYGGDLFSGLQFLYSMSKSEAHIHCIVEGAAYSCGSIIMLGCDTFEVSPFASIMCHTYSGGSLGKGSELKNKFSWEQPWLDDKLREIYTGFLTDDEIQMMLEGKDFWMGHEECASRLEKYVDFYKEEELVNIEFKDMSPKDQRELIRDAMKEQTPSEDDMSNKNKRISLWERLQNEE